MSQHQTPLNRRQFIKTLGAGAAAVSLSGTFGPWVHAQQPFVIGMANPLSTFFGQAAEKTLRLRIQEINDNGGLMGRPLALAVSDSAGRPDQALRAVQDLVLSQGADVLTGFFFSEELLGALPSLPAFRKILLGTGASTPAATIQVQQDYDSFKYFFRVGPTNSFFILQSLAQFSRAYVEGVLGWSSAVVLAEDAAWTQAVTDSLPSLLQAFGSSLQVADSIRYAEDTTDFSSIFQRAEDTGADGIVTVMAHTGLRPTTQWAQGEVSLPMVGINVQAQDGRFDALSGGNAESVVTFTSGAEAPITLKTIPFVGAFAAFADFLPDVNIPSYNAFATTDAIDVLLDSVERASVLPDTDANTDAVIQAMEQTDIVGTQGNISFYQVGETGVSPVQPNLAFPHDIRFESAQGVWVQWQSGELEVLFPLELATSEFVLPPWLR